MGAIVLLITISVLSLFLQGVLLAIPLIFIPLIVMTVLIKDSFVYVLAFTIGILFDSMTLQTVGTTSLFLLAMLLLIRLYDRKFETRNIIFVVMISLITTSTYLLLFGSYSFFIQLSIALLTAGILFSLCNKFVEAKI